MKGAKLAVLGPVGFPDPVPSTGAARRSAAQCGTRGSAPTAACGRHQAGPCPEQQPRPAAVGLCGSLCQRSSLRFPLGFCSGLPPGVLPECLPQPPGEPRGRVRVERVPSRRPPALLATDRQGRHRGAPARSPASSPGHLASCPGAGRGEAAPSTAPPSPRQVSAPLCAAPGAAARGDCSCLRGPVLLGFMAGVLGSRKAAFVGRAGPGSGGTVRIILAAAHNFFIGVTFLQREPAVCLNLARSLQAAPRLQRSASSAPSWKLSALAYSPHPPPLFFLFPPPPTEQNIRISACLRLLK